MQRKVEDGVHNRPSLTDRISRATRLRSQILRAELSMADEDGISVPELMAATGMGRRCVYYRLRDLADTGRIIQTRPGYWRTADQDRHDECPLVILCMCRPRGCLHV